MTDTDVRDALRQRFGRLAGSPPPRPHQTIVSRGSILATLTPKTVRQVQAMLAFCQDRSIVVHPISGGVNWGYGATIPWSVRPAVLLDLRQLDTILGYDERFGILRVQPAVTFAAAQQYLLERKSPFIMNPIGGSPRGSVLANALERGHGTGFYTDRFGALRRLRVILPDGSETTTDFAEAGASGTHRWGAGPTLRGLFSQSPFGVVVEADCLLAPRPKHNEIMNAWLFDPSTLPKVIERFRERRSALRLVLRTGHRLAAEAAAANPALSWPGRTDRIGYPLYLSLQYWADHLGALGAAREEATALLRGTKADVEVLSSWPGIVDREQSRLPARVLAQYVPKLRTDGVTERSVRATYRVRRDKTAASPVDLDRDGVGLFWSTPVVPMVGDEAAEVIDAAERISVKHRIEPDITLVTIDDWRYLDGIFGFLFDATEPKALDRAQRAFDEFQKYLAKRRYPTYRAGIQHRAEDVLPRARREVLAKLSAAVDPNGILSPWRLRSS